MTMTYEHRTCGAITEAWPEVVLVYQRGNRVFMRAWCQQCQAYAPGESFRWTHDNSCLRATTKAGGG